MGRDVTVLPINLAIFSVLLLLSGAVLGLLLIRSQRILIYINFFLAAVASLTGIIAGAVTVGNGVINRLVLPAGIPELPFHLRLDPLSGFFLVVIGVLGFFISIYSLGYVRGIAERRPVGGLVFFFL